MQEKDNDNVIYKIHLYAKGLSKPEDLGMKQLNNLKAFTVHSITMDEVFFVFVFI